MEDPSQIGEYTIVRRLGAGGMGTVFLGRDAEGNEVAIKILPSTDPIYIESFIREVEIIRRVAHSSVVRVLDTSGLRDELPWYAMDYVSGPTLKEVIRSDHSVTILEQDVHDTFPPEKNAEPSSHWRGLVALLLDVCGGLNAIHSLGVVHRDIKPGNIVIRQDGTPVLIDFGIAGQLGGMVGREQLSDYLGGSGTPTYAPAEQLRGETADARADVYAFGCLLFEIVTGRQPYHGENFFDLLTAHSRGAIPSARDLNPDVPIELDRLIGRMLGKRPENRPGFIFDIDSAARSILGLPAPQYLTAQYVYHSEFVGRKKEIAALKQLVKDTSRQKSMLGIVRGEAGIGKTRLLLELLIEADPKVQIVHVSARGDRPAVLRAWDRMKLGRTIAAPELEHALFDSPGFAAILEAGMRKAAADLPFVVILDDVMELDALSLDVISRVLSSPIPGASLIIAFRSEDPGTGMFAALPVDVDIHLDPFNEELLDEIVVSMLALSWAPKKYTKLLHQTSAGNPFVAAEYLRWGIDTGILKRFDGDWQLVNERLIELHAELPVPKRLANMLFSRYAQLDAEARSVMAALVACGDGSPQEFVIFVAQTSRPLADLLSREMLRLDLDGRLWFRQPKWADVIRDATGVEQAKAHHARAVRWLAKNGGSREHIAFQRAKAGIPE
jgi:serine/threonine protein kinase